jgi:CBS domain-containing protein
MTSNPHNVIPGRITEALTSFPPFSLLHAEEVERIAPLAEVQVLVEGDSLWRQGDSPGDDVRFLARGRVEYRWLVDNTEELVDVRDVGDILGLTALLDGNPHRVSAIAVEDSLLYCLPWAEVKGLIEGNDRARNYVRRHLMWGTRVGRSVPKPTGELGEGLLRAHVEGNKVIEPRPLDRLLTCHPDDPVSKAAELIVAKRVPSILVVNEERHPVGIVTSNILVKQIIVSGKSAELPVRKIMAKPVFTVPPQSSATAAILIILRERIGQVCVTEDGTPHSPALDVFTQKDLMAANDQHPAALIREIRLASNAVRLREVCDDLAGIAQNYLESRISGILLGQIVAEIYDELVMRLIEMARAELAEEGVRLPKIPWAWIAVGSDGRREQVLRTDMDNAIVFAAKDPETDEANRKILLQLAEKVITGLVACGFSRCQGGVMASNPRWCRTHEEWRVELKNAGSNPEGDNLLRALILYDLRYVSGNKEICDQLREDIFKSAHEQTMLQRAVAEAAVENPPPLNFWGKFVVEKKGGHAGEFDIKARSLSPIRDAARALVLKYQLTQYHSTGGRWQELREKQPHLEEVAQLAIDAYDELLSLRIQTGLRRGDSGRYLEPEKLTKLQRARLSNVFDIQRMVQAVVRTEFQLDPRTR